MASSSPRLDALVGKVISYLKRNPADDYVVPKFVARAIGEPEVSVVTALRLLAKRRVTKQRFGVFCGNTSVPIGTFDDLGRIPDELFCELCDSNHSPADRTCNVEVFYTVDRERLNRLGETDAAA